MVITHFNISKIWFYLFCGLLITFFIVPEIGLLQKPIRIFTGILFLYMYIFSPISVKMRYFSLFVLFSLMVLGLLMLFNGTLISAYINSMLSFLGLAAIHEYCFDYKRYKNKLKMIVLFCFVSILLQMAIFSSSDGRPSMGYEINHSGSYLFLMFLLCDSLKIKYGKLAVIVLSLFILSRLLIFSLAVFYFVKIGKKAIKKHIFDKNLNIPFIIAAVYVFFVFFSVWYIANVTTRLKYDTSFSRLTTIADNSNYLRFLANAGVVSGIYANFYSKDVLLGIGQANKNEDYLEKNTVMPHNELFNSLVENGISGTLLFSIFSIVVLRKQIAYSNLEYFFSLLFYTLILWVHFILIPSMEMVFIYFVLNLKRQSELKQ